MSWRCVQCASNGQPGPACGASRGSAGQSTRLPDRSPPAVQAAPATPDRALRSLLRQAHAALMLAAWTAAPWTTCALRRGQRPAGWCAASGSRTASTRPSEILGRGGIGINPNWRSGSGRPTRGRIGLRLADDHERLHAAAGPPNRHMVRGTRHRRAGRVYQAQLMINSGMCSCRALGG